MPRQSENHAQEVERQTSEGPRRLKYSELDLNEAWANGYVDGRGELLDTQFEVPSRNRLSIPTEADAKEYWYLLGWEAGMRSAAEVMGV